MRRFLDELSDEDWNNHQHEFKPSRILKKPRPSPPPPLPPPPIESFAYRPKPKPAPNAVVNISDDDDDDWDVGSEEEEAEEEEEALDLEDDDDGEDDIKVGKSGRAMPPRSSRGRRRFANSDFLETTTTTNLDEEDDDDWDDFDLVKSERGRAPLPLPPRQSFVHNLDDDDYVELEDDDVELAKPGPALPQRSSRGRRRFVIDEEDSDNNDGFDDDDDDDEEEFEFGMNGRKGKENGGGRGDFDVVGNALQKCANISAELKKELYGSSSVSMCERYAEVEVSSSSVRIVTQEDIDAACNDEESDFEPLLKPYQLVGVNFLLLLYRKRIGGAILADEMGLGKTVQAVTYLTLLKHLDNDSGPHLIVCPASLLENWEREIKRWCPSFTVILFHGAGRNIYSRELSSLSKSGLPPPFNVLLVCYSLFERRSAQQKDDRKILKRWQWSCVLMDEAHAMKDKNSYRWKNLMSVAKNARQRLMLTGTPLQNDLHELWSLLEFMMPDIFATGDVDLKKLLSAEDSGLILRIKSILGPFILRRLKSDVMQQLVPKIQQVQYVVMGREQSKAYKDAIDEYRAASKTRFTKSSTGSSSNAVSCFPKRQISNYFVQFRKIANHPLLVRRIYSDEDVVSIAKMLYPKGVFGFECGIEKAIQELKTYNDFSIHRLIVLYGDVGAKALSDEHVLGSAKCQALAELLPLLSNDGHRVLIFSQWTQMLDILEWTLEVIGVTYKRLDGSTQVTDRQTIVDTFNSDRSIFACLLSTRAGGQGLNLIGADTVIIHDMDFNPQMDRQAEDRCHRIGQIKPVTIYRLVTKNTVDENIYEIARRKLVLDAAVLESGTELDDNNDVPEKTMGEILSSLLLV